MTTTLKAKTGSKRMSLSQI